MYFYMFYQIISKVNLMPLVFLSTSLFPSLFRDSLIVACINSGTSFFAGFVIFSTLGHLAKVQHQDIKNVAATGILIILYASKIHMFNSLLLNFRETHTEMKVLDGDFFQEYRGTEISNRSKSHIHSYWRFVQLCSHIYDVNYPW